MKIKITVCSNFKILQLTKSALNFFNGGAAGVSSSCTFLVTFLLLDEDDIKLVDAGDVGDLGAARHTELDAVSSEEMEVESSTSWGI